MNKTINITVKDKIAKQTNDTIYVCGNSDFVIDFDFDDEWAEYDYKTARFIYGGLYQDIVFQGNQCPVPIISNTHNIYVGVFAGDLRTTTPAHFSAKKSILCGTGSPAAPAEDVYAQIMEMLNFSVLDAYINTNGNLVLKLTSGIEVVCGYVVGPKGDPFTYDDFTAEQLEALRGPKGDKGVGVASVEQTTTSTEDGGLNVVTVTLTDNTKFTFTIKNGRRGQQGDPGYTPQKGIDYFDGKDGYTPQKGVDYFDGMDGKDGRNGYTPVKGVDYFDGKDGADGKDGYTPVKNIDYFDGKDGKDGKTPEKGVDYFTEADKTEMVSAVINALPVYGGEVENV